MTTKEQIHEAREWLGAAVRGCSIGGRNEQMIRVLLAATAEHETELAKANAARLAAEHDREEARAAEEHMRQERDEWRQRAEGVEERCRGWERLVDEARRERNEERQRAERAETALEAFKEDHAEMAKAHGERVTEMLCLEARIAELEARLAGPTQEQLDDEADMRAFQVGG